MELKSNDVLTGGRLVGINHGLHPGNGRVLVASGVSAPHLSVSLDGGEVISLE